MRILAPALYMEHVRAGSGRLAEKDVGSITAVPLSIEYPIETAGTPEQVVVLAETVNGEVS